MVVEDVHWARDTATLEWLLTFTAVGRTGLSIVVSFCPDEVPNGSLLPRTTSRVLSDVALVRLGLGPLGMVGSRELVASMLDTSEVSAEFVPFLHRHTDGIPPAVEECVLLQHDREDVVHCTSVGCQGADRAPSARDIMRLDAGVGEAARRRNVQAAECSTSLRYWTRRSMTDGHLTVGAGLKPEAGRNGLAAALWSGLLWERTRGAAESPRTQMLARPVALPTRSCRTNEPPSGRPRSKGLNALTPGFEGHFTASPVGGARRVFPRR